VRAKIGLDLSCLEITPETGVERYARRLAEHLPRVAPDLEIVMFVRPGRPAPVSGSGSTVVSVPSLLPRPAWRETALPRALRREGIAILHAPMASVPLRSPVPRVVTIHDVPTFGAPNHEGRLSRHRLRLLHAIHAATRIIVPSAATRDALLAMEPRVAPRVRIIAHGLDPDFQPEGLPLKRDRYSIPPSAPYILFVGTLRPRKDLITLVRAFGILAPHFPALHLVLCGDIRIEESELRAPLVGTAAASHLIIPGYAAREDLPDLYREASVVVIPSRLEGFGLPALEAMACGRPVIVSEDPALLEITGGAASTFPTGDAPALAHALEQILTHPALVQDMSTRARARVIPYTWDRCASAHGDVYRELLPAAATAGKR
jgi:glycosyltransferase involved in cell wall biosynthesis